MEVNNRFRTEEDIEEELKDYKYYTYQMFSNEECVRGIVLAISHEEACEKVAQRYSNPKWINKFKFKDISVDVVLLNKYRIQENGRGIMVLEIAALD